MRWRILSLVLGALPGAAAVLIAGRWLVSPRLAEPVQSLTPDKPEIVAGGASLYDRWQDATGVSEEAAVAFLDGIDTEGARALVEQSEGTEIQPIAFARFAECDRGAALAYAEEKWPLDERLIRIRGVISDWASEDPDACLIWLEGLEASVPAEMAKGRRWKSFLDGFLVSRRFSNPSEGEFERVWRKLEGGRVGRGASFSIGREGLMDDPGTRLPVASYWTLVNAARGKAGWELVMNRMSAGEIGYLGVVGRVWLNDDPEAALSWAAAIPDAAKRAQAFNGLFSTSGIGEVLMPIDEVSNLRWVAENAPEQLERVINTRNVRDVSAWLAEFPADDESSDRARKRVAKCLIESDATASIAWAEAIIDPQVRQNAFREIAWSWSRYERWAAEAWVRERLGWGDLECDQRLAD